MTRSTSVHTMEGVPTGGLDALVAAASAAKQAAGTDKRGKGKGNRGLGDETIDPALQNGGGDSTTLALAALFQNPIFIKALAASASTPPTRNNGATLGSSTAPEISTAGHNDDRALKTKLPNLFSALESGSGTNTHTPFQQTRSGRISRPPVNPPQYSLLQALAAEADTPNFDSLLEAVSSGNKAKVSGSEPGVGALGGLGGESAVGPRNGMGMIYKTKRDERADLWGLAKDGESGGDSWTAQTLADAQNRATSKRHRPLELSTGDEGDGEDEERELPQWPLPPSGPGGRKGMPRDEMLARRRARNRVAAIASRRKKREFVGGLEGRLREKESEYHALEAHCQTLEQQVEQLQQVIISAGLPIPSTIPSTSSMPMGGYSFFDHDMEHDMDQDTSPAYSGINQIPSGDTATLPPFDMFFNVDMDGEDDGEFLPPTSPVPESEDDQRQSTRKGKQRKTRRRGDDYKDNDNGNEVHADVDDDDEEFVDEDVEDEDLFLPIEDVPIPPAAQMESAMRSLGVENQEELARLINKMVVAGKEGMTSEMVDKLKVLLSLVGPNGTWSEKDG